MNLLIKFGYDGRKFSGFQTGNGSNSVEDSILSVLRGYEIASDLRSAARTDRSVSATGNAFMVRTDQRPAKVMGILNSKIADMCFHSYATVDDGFNPRHCDSKIYSYFVISPPSDLEDVLSVFEGKHNFSNFCRRDQRNPIRTIDRIEVIRGGVTATVVFEGKSFVWEQIRSIMGYALSGQRKEDPFSPGVTRRIVARPEPLVLEKINYSEINFIQSVPNSKLRQILRERDLTLLRLKFLESQLQKTSAK